jgi:hypothetical protein
MFDFDFCLIQTLNDYLVHLQNAKYCENAFSNLGATWSKFYIHGLVRTDRFYIFYFFAYLCNVTFANVCLVLLLKFVLCLIHYYCYIVMN